MKSNKGVSCPSLSVKNHEGACSCQHKLWPRTLMLFWVAKLIIESASRQLNFPSIGCIDSIFMSFSAVMLLKCFLINKSEYTKAGDFATILPQLTKLHDQRAAANPNYKYLQEDLDEYKKRDAEKSTTLNEVALKQQRDADDQKTFERNNLKRVAAGLPALKKGETAKAADKLMPSAKNKTDLDFMKVEAGQILTDYITFENKYTGVVRP